MIQDRKDDYFSSSLLYIMLLQEEVTIHDTPVCSYVAYLAADGQATVDRI